MTALIAGAAVTATTQSPTLGMVAGIGCWLLTLIARAAAARRRSA